MNLSWKHERRTAPSFTVNVGQVKRLARPFYDRLRAAQAAGLNVSNALPAGMRGAYP